MSDFKTILQQNKIIIVGVAVACIAAGALAGLVFRAPADGVVVESTSAVNETAELPVVTDASVVADTQTAAETVPPDSVMAQVSVQDTMQGPVFAAAPVVDETIRMEIQTGELPKKMILASPTVTANQNLPVEYTCYRKGKSPPLSWKNPPTGTQSFVVTLDNPNDPRGSKTHWMAYNIPANQGALPADLSAKGQNPNGLSEGKNDFDRDGYAGPCIPKGAHTFIYRIYALDVNPMLPPGVSRNALVSVMNGHILDMAELPAIHQYR